MIFPFKVKLADGATLTVKISDSRRCDELKEPFPVSTMYLPLKAKTKRKGVAKPLRELLPAGVDDKKFKDDLLNSFKEVTVLFVCVCVCVCVCVPAHVCVNECVSAFVYVWVYMCVCVYLCMYVHVRVCICMYVYTCIYFCLRVHVCK